MLRRPYIAASPVPDKAPKKSRQYISRTTAHRYTHKKEAVRNIIYLWQHDETAVPDSADSTAPLINSCFKSRLLRHLSTSSFQRYLIIGMPLCVCQALFYKKSVLYQSNIPLSAKARISSTACLYSTLSSTKYSVMSI